MVGVGELLGIVVGDSVVGSAVGAMVGSSVGIAVGAGLGESVSSAGEIPVGVREGDVEVGALVGRAVVGVLVGKEGARVGEKDGASDAMVGEVVHSGTSAPVKRHFSVPPQVGMNMHGIGPRILLGVVVTSAKLPMSRPRRPRVASALMGPIGRTPVKLFWGRKISRILSSRSDICAQTMRGSRISSDIVQLLHGSFLALAHRRQLGPSIAS